MRRTLLGLIVATAVGGGSASAHHSYGAYFENRPVHRVRGLGAGAQANLRSC